MIKFEWDAAKAKSNLRKHGVSFDEAQSVFYDEFARQFFDDAHAGDEDRFIMLGVSNQSRMLIVCHCERGDQGRSSGSSPPDARRRPNAVFTKGRTDEEGIRFFQDEVAA
ncbi:MAG: BrnT family toxin [Rhodocyclaceae bacterium]|nr:BrnT family toxin [Rhodocyclaceae bacterium]MCB1963605.1 BrnT family toxin [Rhodocyclaceae bacterium]